MAEKLDFPFVKKEGKYFSSILSTEDSYSVQNGEVVTVPNGKVVSGVKGAFMKVRLSVNTTEEAELFSVNSEMFPSSR